MKFIFVAFIAFSLLCPLFSYAQESFGNLKVKSSALYQSTLDSQMTIKKISILPANDNVGGIYARPAEEQITQLINSDHRFQLGENQYAGSMISLDDLETNPQQVQDLAKGISSDAIMACRITKGPDGIQVHLSLFLKADGQLIAREVIKEKPTASIVNIRSAIKDLFSKVIKQIPYDGLVLSRNNSLVTINLGKENGLQVGQTLTAVLLIKATRHPKLHFLISTDKDVLGKIKLQKVDDAISFGQIITEEEFGAIQKDTKISGVEFVQYEAPLGDSFNAPKSAPDKKISFGDNPQEWRPSQPPSFGKVGAQLGIGQARNNTTLQSAGALNGRDSLYPSVKLYAELWLTSEWIFDFEMKQGIMSFNNPGGSPSKLSGNESAYLLSFGYNFMVQDDFFGPSILVSLGFANYKLDVDSSSPLTFNSTSYNGMFLGLKGTMPVTDDKKWNLGASLKYFITSKLSESPQSSGSSSNTITQFSILGFYQKNTKLRFTGSLDFSLFSSRFGGGGSRPDPATDASQKYTTLLGGIEYLF